MRRPERLQRFFKPLAQVSCWDGSFKRLAKTVGILVASKPAAFVADFEDTPPWLAEVESQPRKVVAV